MTTNFCFGLKLESDPAAEIVGEEHFVDVIYKGVVSSGDSMVAGNFAVEPTGSGASWLAGIFAKVTQGATAVATGYMSAAEFEINNACVTSPAMFPLVLNFNNSSGTPGSVDSYIALRDYGNTKIRSLLWIPDDHTPGTKSDTALVTTFADGTHISHAIRVLIGTSPTPYWILLSSQAPSGT